MKRQIKNQTRKSLTALFSLMLLFPIGGAVASNKRAALGSSDVILQGFHWNSVYYPFWWRHVNRRVQDLGRSFSAIWLPNPSKSAPEVNVHGPRAQGYLPTEYNNFDSDYGSANELRVLLRDLKRQGVKPIADLVINHRSGQSQVVNTGARIPFDPKAHRFTNPNMGPEDIVSEDNGAAGGNDTGQDFFLAPDINHNNRATRRKIWEYMKNLQTLGFEGWRYDYAKGYSPRVVGLYNRATSPAFSVAELWEDFTTAEAGRAKLKKYIDSTGQRTQAFDFTTKAILQNAVGQRKYSILRDGRGHAAGLLGLAPGQSVTFIDNHDTGSSPGGDGKGGQMHWEFGKGVSEPDKQERIMEGYAYILTHPGTPCVYWPHYYDWKTSAKPNGMKPEIDRLIALRKELGITSMSPMRVVAAKDGGSGFYTAMIQGTKGEMVVKIGPGTWQPGKTKWKERAQGTYYKVWAK